MDPAYPSPLASNFPTLNTGTVTVANGQDLPTPPLVQMQPWVPFVTITGGSSVEVTVHVPPSTTTDAAGSAVVVAAPPSVVTGITGGVAVTLSAPDDGITAETSMFVITPSDGRAPFTLHAISTPGKPVTETGVSVVGGTVVTVTPAPTTFATDVGGRLTTSTMTPAPVVTTTGGSTVSFTRVTTPGKLITTLLATTINGTPTTISTVLTITPTPSPGMSTTTPDSSTNTRTVPGSTLATYLAASFLPTLLAVALSIPVAAIDANAKRFAPFRALASPHGAAGPELTARYGAVPTPAQARRLLRQPVPLVSTALVWLSRLLAPLAAEAVGFKLHGVCSQRSITGCAIAFSITPGPAYALMAIMAAMAVLLLVLAVLLRRWETGLAAEPWSVVGGAVLVLERRFRWMLEGVGEPSEAELEALFREGRFRLAEFATMDLDEEGPAWEYGIVPDWEGAKAVRRDGWPVSAPKGRNVPFLALTYTARSVFISMLLGLMALIVYYSLNWEDNGFELFMSSQAFGVKFFFAALGNVITSFWTSFYTSKSSSP